MDTLKEISYLTADAAYCVGCKNCELACASRKAEKYTVENLSGNISVVPNINVCQEGDLKIPVYCRQCEDASCERKFPVKAITRENGVLILNREKCIGCGICKKACPYNAITMGTYNDGSKIKKFANKCDLCIDRQLDNIEPCCYASCPTKAIKLV